MANGTGPLGGGNARPTMADIARELGVAKITVSRALSDSPTVKESTRRLIRDTAERMGYRLNISARNLRQQRTRTIAVVIEMAPSHDRLMSEPYPLSLLGGIMQELTAAGQNMVLTTIELFAQHPPSADGVILLGQGVHDDAACSVPGGQAEAIVMAREMVDKDYVVALFHLVRVVIVFVSTPLLLGIVEGREAVDRLLAEGTAFDGVFAASDAIAMGAIEALQARGLSVPGDVSVVGFDDSPGAAIVSPKLTTIRQDWAVGGELLAKKVLDLVAGKGADSRAMSVELVARES